MSVNTWRWKAPNFSIGRWSRSGDPISSLNDSYRLRLAAYLPELPSWPNNHTQNSPLQLGPEYFLHWLVSVAIQASKFRSHFCPFLAKMIRSIETISQAELPFPKKSKIAKNSFVWLDHLVPCCGVILSFQPKYWRRKPSKGSHYAGLVQVTPLVSLHLETIGMKTLLLDNFLGVEQIVVRRLTKVLQGSGCLLLPLVVMGLFSGQLQHPGLLLYSHGGHIGSISEWSM